MEFMNFLESLSYNDSFKILCIVIALDTVFRNTKKYKGKESKFNYWNRRNYSKSWNAFFCNIFTRNR